ncbi:MAG TPA: hypothetical protein VGH29_13610, partial [Candidatus Binataceae bacterium]
SPPYRSRRVTARPHRVKAGSRDDAGRAAAVAITNGIGTIPCVARRLPVRGRHRGKKAEQEPWRT